MSSNDFHSLNKGVFVIPYDDSNSEAEASTGPSLRDLYNRAFDGYDNAQREHEAGRSSEQLDRVGDWLERCAQPSPLRQGFSIQRLPFAVMQGTSNRFATGLPKRTRYVSTISGREVGDIATATRLVAVGFLGEAALEAKKAGRTPIDEVERWWRKLRDKPALLVYVEQAQAIPATVFAELVYILNLHPDVSFRLLVSVPSISTFLSSTTFLEPSEVDLSVLGSSQTGKGDASVAAVLEAACGSAADTPLYVSDDVARELAAEARLLGGGTSAVLKTLHWLLLRHSNASALAGVCDTSGFPSAEKLKAVQKVVMNMRKEVEGPGSTLFQVDNTPDVVATQNPAPRLSILQALRNPDLFLMAPPNGAAESVPGHVEGDAGASSVAEPSTQSPTSRKSTRGQGKVTDYAKMSGKTTRQKRQPTTQDPERVLESAGYDEGACGPFKEIQALHTLWQSAGKSINLWDWLDGFRTTLLQRDSDSVAEDNPQGTPTKGKRRRADSEGEDEDLTDPETQIRVHARFIRYVEEARMMGLVRARGRGRGKGSDEVAKGVLL